MAVQPLEFLRWALSWEKTVAKKGAEKRSWGRKRTGRKREARGSNYGKKQSCDRLERRKRGLVNCGISEDTDT